MNNLFSESVANTMKIVLEYAALANQSYLTEEQADRLGKILEVASEDALLDFWLTEVDHIIGHRLNLLDEDDRESYQDQQAMMVEYGFQNNDIITCPNLDIQKLTLIMAELGLSCNLSEETGKEQPL